MEIIAIVVLVIGIYLAAKVVGFLFKAGLILVALAAAYWLLAPALGAVLPL